jgi:hypothetical protein
MNTKPIKHSLWFQPEVFLCVCQSKPERFLKPVGFKQNISIQVNMNLYNLYG